MNGNLILFSSSLFVICAFAFFIVYNVTKNDIAKMEKAKDLREKRTRNLKPLPPNFRLRPKAERVDKRPKPRK